jgi:transcriptional regulator with XRE-family HTH domain
MKPTQDNQKSSKEEWQRTLAEQDAIIDFTEEVLRWMEEVKVSRSQLAEKMRVEPAAVSRLLGGSNNFTLRTMVRIALALRARLKFSLVSSKPKRPQYVEKVVNAEVPARSVWPEHYENIGNHERLYPLEYSYSQKTHGTISA